MNPACKHLSIFTVCMVIVSAAIYYYMYRGKFKYVDGGLANDPSQYQQFEYPYSSTSQVGSSIASVSLPPSPDREPRPHTVVRISGKPVIVLYSARYDSALQSVVLVGYFNNRVAPPPRLHCQVSDTALTMPWQQAKHHVIREGHSRPYDGVLYFCPTKDWTPAQQSATSTKVHVKVEHSGASSGSAVLPLQFVATGEPLNRGAAACVTALRYIPGQEPETRFIIRLVEFIEVNRILGVEHFYFYNWSLPVNTSRILRHYVGLGWVSVSQWSLPPEIHPENDIHYFGQMALTNDCLYSARDRHRLVAFIDIDEFLVPLGGAKGTVVEAAAIHALQDTGNGNCALGFRHGLFPLLSDAQLSWSRLPSGLEGCRVTSLLHSKRAKEVMPFTQRSKLLVVARQIKEMGIHFIWDTWSGCRTKQLDPASEGLVHHMRTWSPVDLVEDTSMFRFEKEIGTAMIGARQRLKQLLGLDFCQ